MGRGALAKARDRLVDAGELEKEGSISNARWRLTASHPHRRGEGHNSRCIATPAEPKTLAQTPRGPNFDKVVQKVDAILAAARPSTFADTRFWAAFTASGVGR